MNMKWNDTTILLLLAAALSSMSKDVLSFTPTPLPRLHAHIQIHVSPLPKQSRNHHCLRAAKKQQQDESIQGDSYEISDSSSKGVVSTLTGIVNFIMGKEEEVEDENELLPLPKTPQELMDFIRDDYVKNNYLWTGKIHLPAFEDDCRFTDPTLSFVGTKTFVNNVQNLVPIVNFLTEQQDTDTSTSSDHDNDTKCRSDLLDISINEQEGYVQTRWNMVGDLS